MDLRLNMILIRYLWLLIEFVNRKKINIWVHQGLLEILVFNGMLINQLTWLFTSS